MKISGIQKVSLVDYDGQVATTIFTSGCNFACPFCHNAGLVNSLEQNIAVEDIMEYLMKRKNVLTAVCISGGEPTLNHDLPEFISQIKKLGYRVKLDTNGSNLEMVKYLVENNLIDYIAMDIKNSIEHYSKTIGKDYNFDITKTIKYIMNCGIDYEFRTTLVLGYHTNDNISKIGHMIKGAKKYYLQKFEDSGNCLRQGLQAIDYETAQHYRELLLPFVKLVQLRGY